MDLSRPPQSDAELLLWKVFCRTTEQDIWQIINRWIKRYGNPFDGMFEERSYEETQVRGMFQEALMFLIHNTRQ